ncbi:MAG TPA: CHAT domain-containing protein, partial [Gemmatimonadales bacterium]|nr:CHAT domain-containing protein [Gemmatimonadales bacterium]
LARSRTLEALRLHRASESPLQELRDLLVLAEVSMAADSQRVAVDNFRAAERLRRKLDTRIARVEVALAGAALALKQDDPRGALRILSARRHDLALGGHGGEWQAASLRARAFSRLSLLDSAAAAGRHAVAAVDKMRGSYGSGFLRNTFAADKASAYGELVDVLLRLGRTAEAFEVSDAARNNALVEHLAGASGEGSRSPATVRSVGEASGLLRRIDSLVVRLDAIEETPRAARDAGVRAQAAALAGHLAEARGAYEALLVRVAEQDAPGSTMLGWGSTRVTDVQGVLGPDEALVEYLVTPSRLVIFVVTRSAVRSVGSEIGLDDLSRRVRLARDLVGEPKGGSGAHDEVLSGLHALLVAPVEQAGLVRGVERLILIPHSVLTYLPFAALKRPGGGRYLMEDYSLLHLPSAATLAVLRGADRGGAGDRSGGRGTVFAPFPKQLPGSLREARAFQRAVTSASTESGHSATEPRLRRALAGTGTVHVASHGVMNPRNPMFSRIELFPGNGGGSDDGRLEVHELMELRIGAGLIFLSGCETGAGSAWSTQFARGEDYTTLAQAFLYAGAGNVVATLWPIGDDGAAAFAEKFYVHAGTATPSRALAAAQREIAKDPRYSDPYYWAAYQVFGPGGAGAGSHRPAESSVQLK